MAFHPVNVALERVDFTVMRQHAERLREPPLREGIGGIPLVIDRERALEPLIHQVRVEHCNLLGEHHAFVDHRAARQRRDIKLAYTRSCCRFFNATTDHIKLTLERFLVHTFGIGDENLFDLGACRISLFTKASNIDGDVTPAIDVVAHAQNFGFNDCAAGLLRAEICARQEDLANRHQLILARRVTCALDLIIEERDGDLNVDTSAITRLAIRVHSTAVPDRFQGINASFNDFARRRTVQRNNKTNAARTMFFAFIIKTILGHILALGFLVLHPICIKLSHQLSPSSGANSAIVSLAVILRCVPTNA